MKHNLLFVLTVILPIAVGGEEPINIGSRRELFVDSTLVERVQGGAEFRLHASSSRTGTAIITWTAISASSDNFSRRVSSRGLNAVSVTPARRSRL
jgi:hypothetical protein